jgi:predicted membrane protein (TIGR00267 family)
MMRYLDRFRRYLEVTNALEIARRLFVMNAFDGTLTILGVIIGAHLSGMADPRAIITAGIGGSLAMGISGISGAFMAERAERRRDQRKLESAMLRNMDDTHFARASRFATLVVAVVDGISPAICAMVLIVPFLMVPAIGIDTAFYISISLSLILLFVLGIFLARISDERPITTGLQMILVGIITIILVGLVSSQ